MWILSSKEVVSLYTSADGKALFGFCNCLYYSSNNNSFNLKVSILYQGQSWRVQAITYPHTSRPVPCFPSLCVPHASPESTHLLSPALWPWVAGLLNEKSIKPQVKILRFFFFFFFCYDHCLTLGKSHPTPFYSSSLRSQFSHQQIHLHSFYDNVDLYFSNLISFHAPSWLVCCRRGPLCFFLSRPLLILFPLAGMRPFPTSSFQRCQ